MTCAMCSSRVERSLRKLPGLLQVDVNLATETAHIEYDESVLALTQIGQVIEKAGYKLKTQEWVYRPDSPPNPQELAAMTGVLEQHWTPPQLRLRVLPLPGLKKRLHQTLGQARENSVQGRSSWTLVGAWLLTLPLLLAMLPGLHLDPRLQWLLASLVQFGPGLGFYQRGWSALWARSPDMNTLVMLGTSAAYAQGCVQVWRGQHHHLSFEGAAVVISMMLLGKALEARAKGQARQALEKLLELQPRQALLLDGEEERWVEAEELLPGDVVRILPGGAVPSDGVVLEGTGWADESMLTGEAEPVAKGSGDRLVGGSVIGHSPLLMRVQAVGEDTTLAGIARVVARAQEERPPIQHLADRVVVRFVPSILALAALTGVGWAALGSPLALDHAITVLVVACPCAMGLAVPTSLLVGSGRAAQLGILFHSGEALQRLAEVQGIAFDKTGTLTEGRLSLAGWQSPELEESSLLQLAASVEQGSEHPLARAMVEEARRREIPLLEARDFAIEPGWGAAATLALGRLEVGQMREEVDLPPEWHQEGWTVVHVHREGQRLGSLALADSLKSSAREALTELSQLGLESQILSGDQASSVERLAGRLQIAHWRARLTPEQKALAVDGLAFVGDGINDAPALARAQVGMAVARGAGIALESAQVVLMRDDLRLVPRAVVLARRVLRNIRWNLIWAFGYNVLLLPWAALGNLQPAWGGAAMALSSLFVVSNALRLRRG